jgi:hemin uptake protein HemP
MSSQPPKSESDELGSTNEKPRSRVSLADPLRPKRLMSNLIFGGSAVVEIDHHGTVYRLTQTTLGKLILTK